MYLTSPGRSADIGLQLGKACYPCSSRMKKMLCMKTKLQCSYVLARKLDLSYSVWRSLSVLTAASSRQRCERSQVVGIPSLQTDILLPLYSPVCRSPGQVGCQTPFMYMQKRHITLETFEKYFSPDNSPIALAMFYLVGIHDLTGLPYYATIGICTLLLRLSVGLPFRVVANRNQAREVVVQARKQAMTDSFEAQMKKSLEENPKLNEAKLKLMMSRKIKDMVRRERMKAGCHPAKTVVYPLLQIPVWLSMSFALRNMAGAKVFGVDAVLHCPEMIREGVLWFPNLLVPDPTIILPVMIGALHLINNEISFYKKPTEGKLSTFIKWTGRGAALIFVPFACIVPSAVSVYWMYSALTAMLVNILFTWDTAKRFLGVTLKYRPQDYYRYFLKDFEKKSGLVVRNTPKRVSAQQEKKVRKK